MPERAEQPSIRPIGEIFRATVPAKFRIMNISPLIYTKTRIPGVWAMFLSTDSIHWLGANSVAAVSTIQEANRRNMGRIASRNISLAETPDATRPVAGNFWQSTIRRQNDA